MKSKLVSNFKMQGFKDPRIDAYIAKSAAFARPILMRIRELIHTGCPEVTETIKWGMPSFEYKGPFATMAAFKQHAVFGFWKYKLIKDPKGLLGERSNQGGEAMGNMGKLTSLKDLPSDKAMLDFIKQAKKLNDEGVKVPSREKKPKPPLVVPDYFISVLKKNTKAVAGFEQLPPSHKREYVEWITEAKTEATRNNRMAKAVEWISEGKGRNWKYERK